MTWAIFSDVHGNLEALVAVAEDLSRHGVTRSFFIGDAVGYGPSPNECLELITDLTSVRLLGNHDYAVLQEENPEEFNKHAKAAIDWTREAISAEARNMLQSFEINCSMDNLHLVHSSPLKPEKWDYILDPSSAATAFRHFSETICFVGHTHQPRIFRESNGVPCHEIPLGDLQLEQGTRYMVNVGSVGQPRDGDRRACYVLYDPDTRRLAYQRVAYDIAVTQTKMRAAKLPEFLITRLETGR